MPTNVRRSTRNSSAGRGNHSATKPPNLKKAASKKGKPRVGNGVAHQLLKKKSDVLVQKGKESDEEYTEEVKDAEEDSRKKKLCWESYSKKDLYFHWVKARNDATDLRKAKNDLDAVRKKQAKEIRELKKELKEADSVYDGAVALEDQHAETKNELLMEKEKNSEMALEKKQLMDEKKSLMTSIKDKYDKMANKAEYDNVKALGQLKIKFTECDLKLKAKNSEVKELIEKNRALKKKVTKLKEMVFAMKKSDLQVASMEEKCQVR